MSKCGSWDHPANAQERARDLASACRIDFRTPGDVAAEAPCPFVGFLIVLSREKCIRVTGNVLGRLRFSLADRRNRE
jgi:hypothetical protein